MRLNFIKMKRFICFFLLPMVCFAQQTDPLRTSDAQAQERWVDSIYKKMSIDEKIGQLFMVQVFSSHTGKNIQNVKDLITKHHIGGIIFSKGGPVRQAKMTNEFQKVAKTPLFIAMDAEWGLAMRLDSVYAFPWNMTLGALKDNSLVEKTGKHIAKHCKRLGVHIDFAPDIDINTNPDNPIIGNRSFGENKENVAQKGIAFTKGMQSEGVLANAKHFPGHGDTSKDSHLTLPTINFSKERIEEIELYPFKKLISANVASIMVGHLHIPALDEKPSSISHKIITDILKKQLGYKGLIFTDALGMKGVADYADTAEVDLQAFLAGNDILLMSSDAIKGISKIKKAYNQGVITEERLAYSVKKILRGKYWAGLNKYKPIDLKELYKDLNTKEDDLLTEKIYENAITIAKNKDNILPLKNLDTQKTAYIKFGDDTGWEFFKNLNYYDNIPQLKSGSWEALNKEMAPYDRIIIGLHRSNATPWTSYKFSETEKNLLTKIAQKKKVILTLFVKPYALLDIPEIENINSIVIAYQNHNIAQQKAAQIIYGAIDAKGILPVSIHKNIPVQTSFFTENIKRLGYGLPENAGLNSLELNKIDSVISDAIQKQMTPSAQVLVARNGVVVYNKSFGYFTYDKKEKVNENTLYDLASLTKILATLPEIIQLYDQKKISLDTELSTLLPELKNTNKGNITIKEALSHYGQLQSWIPFYQKTMDMKAKTLFPDIYQDKKSAEYPIQVADNMFIKKDYDQIILKSIADSDLIKKKRYLYSDLSYYLFQKYIEKYLKKPLNEVIDNNFYKSIGAHRLTFLPLNQFSKTEIVPSEYDKVFRKQEVRGFVHDQGAAMLGGVAGHAGLFGTTNDIAKIMQMFLQKGYYGGVRFFSESAFDTFNTTYFWDKQNRRGLGFDKPQPKGETGPTCDCTSPDSFGHSGFTGTYAWADPKSKIVYVFLSNRTYPDAENKKLITEGIRTKIQQIIQNAIIE